MQSWSGCCEVVRLNRNNFEETVLHVNDPWIIGIRPRISEEEIDNVYEQVKDRINLGSIEEKEYINYLQDIDAPARAVIFNKIRVFPFGAKLHKLRKWENAESCTQAIRKALQSIPDVTIQLPNIVDQKNELLKNFIQTAYSNLPPKFPIVLFTDQKATPMYYKQISLKFASLFHFGVIRHPPPSTLAVYAITKLPRLVVLLTEVLKDGTPRIKPIHYEDNLHGALDYPRVLRFLYIVHMKYFKELPGNTHATAHDIDEMETKPGSGEPCNENLDVCIIIVGRDLYNSESNRKEVEEIKANLSTVKQQLIDRGKSIELHQLDINCNEAAEMDFDIYAEDCPVLVLLRPKRHLFALAVTNELPISIESFLEKALSGKIGHRKYEKLPELKFGKCGAANEKGDDDNKANLKIEL
eukprot:gene8113-8982_t